MIAAHRDSPHAVKFFLENGANPTRVSLFGYGIARYASRHGVSVIAQLLDTGVSISPITNDDGRNALQAVCSCVSAHSHIFVRFSSTVLLLISEQRTLLEKMHFILRLNSMLKNPSTSSLSDYQIWGNYHNASGSIQMLKKHLVRSRGNQSKHGRELEVTTFLVSLRDMI